MKPLCKWFAILTICLIMYGLWNPTRAAGDPITAAGAFKFYKGTVAPEFNIENLAGNPVQLQDFRGKVVLLDFWATW